MNEGKLIKLNIGSGSAKIEHNFVNVDLDQLPGVKLRADAHCLPIHENSVDTIQCMNLIEHIADPQTMIDETYRVIKPGGEIYIMVPFIHPYHEAPIDCNRWTDEGLRQIMQKFSAIKVGVLGGPTAALIEVFHVWLSILFSFNSEKMCQVVYLLLLPFVKPFKVIDRILLNKYRTSHRIANFLYFYGRKPGSSEIESQDNP